MKHLDDGILQAWLDGPRSELSPLERDGIELHLSECERCSRRIEEMEGDTLLVNAFLSESDPEGEAIPPFEEVLERARHDQSNRRKRTAWTRAGWAASVAAAGVVGWMANGAYTADTLNRGASESQMPAAMEASADERVSAEGEGGPAEGEAPPTAEQAVTVAKMADAAEAADTPSDAPESPARVVVRGTVTDEGNRALEAGRGDTVAADLRLGESAVALEELVVTGAPAESRAREVGEMAAAASQPTAEPVPSMDAIAGAAPAPWRPVSRSQAEAEAGFTILTVPDLAVLRIEVDSSGEPTLVRVFQEVGGGRILEMVQGVGVGHAQRLVAPEGGSRASAIRGEVLVVATAPVPLDVLAELLERIR